MNQSGGYIRVHTALGLGTEFLIYLPRTDTLPEKIAPPERATDHAPCGTILIAEDQAAVRNTLQRILTADGYTVLTAANGAEAGLGCSLRARMKSIFSSATW